MPGGSSPDPATSASSLFGPPGREIKSRWDTWSSWTDRIFIVPKSGAKATWATTASDGLSRPFLGQTCQPLCSHRKLASNIPHHAFGKDKRKKEALSFIWHLRCAPHCSRQVCGAVLFTPPVNPGQSAYFTEKGTSSQTLGDLLKINLNRCQKWDHTQG